MRKDKLSRLYPILRVISKLSDSDRHVLIKHLSPQACEGIYECCHNSLRNKSLPDEEQKKIQQHYLPKKKQLRKLWQTQPPISESSSKEDKVRAAAKFAERRKRSLVNVSDDLGLILKTSLPLIKRYVGAHSDEEDNQQQLEEEDSGSHSMREAHFHE